MIRRYDFGGLGASSNPFDEDEDVDPRSGLTNLADIMLVFACGLMLALVSFWNLDVSTLNQVEVDDSTTVEIEDLENQDAAAGGSSYVDMGSVYMDEETGKMYMVPNDTSESTE
jgi:hypothetical protein